MSFNTSIVFNNFCSINSNKLVFWWFLSLDILFYHLFLSKVMLERCARLSLLYINCFDVYLSNAVVGLLSKILFECIANASAKQLWMSYIPCYPCFVFVPPSSQDLLTPLKVDRAKNNKGSDCWTKLPRSMFVGCGCVIRGKLWHFDFNTEDIFNFLHL